MYTLDYRYLAESLRVGYRLERIHCAVEYTQSYFAKTYIERNAELRKLSETEMKGLFIKISSNSLFGRSLLSQRKLCVATLVTNKIEFQKCMKKPHLKRYIKYGDYSGLALFARKIYKPTHPLYFAFAILSVSKMLLAGFHHRLVSKQKGKRSIGRILPRIERYDSRIGLIELARHAWNLHAQRESHGSRVFTQF